MNRDSLLHALRACNALLGDGVRLLVAGSQAILATTDRGAALPEVLFSSGEIDILPLADRVPDQEEMGDVLEGSLGEGSWFHRTHGFCVDGIDETTVTLAPGWAARTIKVFYDAYGDTRSAEALAPCDIAVAKLVASRPRLAGMRASRRTVNGCTADHVV